MILKALSALCFLAWSGGAGAQDAVSYQINPEHNGSVVYPGGFKTPLVEKWTKTLGNLVTYPLVANGKVFVTAGLSSGSYGSIVYAFDLSSGNLVWQQEIAGTYFSSFNAYDENTIFNINFNGTMHALDSATGAIRWAVDLPGEYEFSGPPTARDGIVYTVGAGYGGTLYAVNEQNGHIAWMGAASGAGTTSPTVSADGVFVANSCGDMELDGATGKARWQYNAGCYGTGGVTAPLYDQLFFTSGIDAKGQLAQIQTAYDGKIRAQAGPATYVPPALQDGRAFFVSNFGLDARVATNGNEIWHFDGDNQIQYAPVVVDGIVFVESGGGHLYALGAGNGQLLQTIQLPPGSNFDEGGVIPGVAAGEGLLVVSYLNTVTVFSPSIP